LLFSLTLVPLLCFVFMRRGLPEKENFIVRAISRVYRPLLEASLRRRYLVVGISIIGLAASLALVPQLGSEFLPELNEGATGVNPSFSQPIRDNVLESISQIDGQIVVKLFSTEPEVLRDKTKELLREVSTVRGVARAFIDRAGQTPQLQIEIDRERSARYGLN